MYDICIIYVAYTIILFYTVILYIYAFSRRFYPKRLTAYSAFRLYIFFVFNQYVCSLEFNPQPYVLIKQCSTTEPQEHLYFIIFGMFVCFCVSLYVISKVNACCEKYYILYKILRHRPGLSWRVLCFTEVSNHTGLEHVGV